MENLPSTTTANTLFRRMVKQSGVQDLERQANEVLALDLAGGKAAVLEALKLLAHNVELCAFVSLTEATGKTSLKVKGVTNM